MRRILLGLSAVLFLIGSSLLYAQSTIPPGFPPGVFIGRGALDASPAATFQGPGDIVSGATAWGSCARAYNLAYANGTNGLCDLVAVTGGAVVGTLRVATTGFADLTAYFAGSVTPAAACAAASGGSCKVTKVYDQTGNTNHFIQATLGNMPALTFSAANGLPGMTFNNAGAAFLATGNVTIAQPFSISGVYKRTANFTTLSAIIGITGGTIVSGGDTSADTGQVSFNVGANKLTITALDNNLHALNGVANTTSSALNIDGSDTTGNAGPGAYSAAAIRFGRSASSLDGAIMEGGIWAATFTSQNRTDLNVNQHGANGYNF